MEGEDFAELVGSIYDAALDPRVWPVMLNCLAIRCRQVQPNRSLISPTDELAMTTPRGDREYLRAFTEYWASHNFWKTSGKLWQRDAREGILDSNILCAPAAAGNNE